MPAGTMMLLVGYVGIFLVVWAVVLVIVWTFHDVALPPNDR